MKIGKRQWNDHSGKHCVCSRPAVAKRGGDWICARCLGVEAENAKHSIKKHGVSMAGKKR